VVDVDGEKFQRRRHGDFFMFTLGSG
jgi:hypothetical protein